MTDRQQFSIRYLFRVEKKLNIKSKEHRFKICEWDALLVPRRKGRTIDQSEWLIMRISGFGSENSAQIFARKLRAASDLSSVSCRMGIDSGIDRVVAGVTRHFKNQIFEQTGLTLRNTIHGIDVMPEANSKFFDMEATPTLLKQPEPFLGDLTLFFEASEKMSQHVRDIILLLNYALMRSDPVAQIIFAFSAVEMLGQKEQWSADQKQLLDNLASSARQSDVGTEAERAEVAVRIKDGLQKVGLRQGVMRLLDENGLADLKPKWDELYGRRSTLVHGLAPQPGVDYVSFASEVVALCGRILLTLIAKEVPEADRHLNTYYKLPVDQSSR